MEDKVIWVFGSRRSNHEYRGPKIREISHRCPKDSRLRSREGPKLGAWRSGMVKTKRMDAFGSERLWTEFRGLEIREAQIEVQKGQRFEVSRRPKLCDWMRWNEVRAG